MDAKRNTYRKEMNAFITRIKDMRQGNEEAMDAYRTFSRAVLEPGALDTKTKELICLSLSVAALCDGCIGFHTKGALNAGATREEIVEALRVTVLMGGGPSYIYAAHVLDAVDELTQSA